MISRRLALVILVLVMIFVLIAFLLAVNQALELAAQVQTAEGSGLEAIDNFEMEALVTAYSPEDPGVGSITYSGIPVDRGVAAVDPKVIPIGSIVYVPGYGYAVAADTGGLIRGKHIDVYLPSRHEAVTWGVKKLKITVYVRKLD